MNKSDLVETLAKQADIPKKQAEQIVNLFFDSMSNALANGKCIEIRGFGSFVPRRYSAYEGRNPRTGEVVHVAKKCLPFFKVGREMRDRVNTASIKDEKKG